MLMFNTCVGRNKTSIFSVAFRLASSYGFTAGDKGFLKLGNNDNFKVCHKY